MVGAGAFGFVKAGVQSVASHGPVPIVEKRAFNGEEDSLKRENHLFDILDDRDLIPNDVGGTISPKYFYMNQTLL